MRITVEWWPVPGGVHGRYGDVERTAPDLGTLTERMGPAVARAVQADGTVDIQWRQTAPPAL